MKHSTTHSFRIVILIIIAIFILSCSLSSGSEPTAVPTNTSVPTIVQPTNTEVPTLAPTNTMEPTVEIPTIPVPTNPPAVTEQVIPTEPAAAPDYFTEEFDGDLSNWEYFYMSGDENKGDFYTEDGNLVFYLNGEEIYAYLLYSPYYYEDTVLTVVAENRGYNNNNVSLICRYDPDEGWYEFNIANNGLYWIYFYDLRDPHYKSITNGGSTAIRSGKEVNTYTAVCSGRSLALYINGVEVTRLNENQYVLKKGQVGVSVSSFSVYPIEVDIQSFTIDYPQ